MPLQGFFRTTPHYRLSRRRLGYHALFNLTFNAGNLNLVSDDNYLNLNLSVNLGAGAQSSIKVALRRYWVLSTLMKS
jgi:hypothetical protein